MPFKLPKTTFQNLFYGALLLAHLEMDERHRVQGLEETATTWQTFRLIEADAKLWGCGCQRRIEP